MRFKTKEQVHTILGAGGSVSNVLTKELLRQNKKVRLVSRSRYSIVGTESYKADITLFQETLKSIEGSNIVYLCIGLAYNTKVWELYWPIIMENTINACKSVGAKLIFFDNVYMYGKVNGSMTETTPYNPISKKGEIRAKISLQLEEEIKRNNINAIIARSADLYGPFATKTSLPYILSFSKIINNKKALILINPSATHSFTYTTDCAKSLVLLAENEECDNQIWHLPTYNPALSAKSFTEQIAKEMNIRSNHFILKKWMIKINGLFNTSAKELLEMLYQNKYNYHFDSTKFNTHFEYNPTTYIDGIKSTIEFIKREK